MTMKPMTSDKHVIRLTIFHKLVYNILQMRCGSAKGDVMESTLVSARVPKATKEAGAEVLRAIGATPTQLVNSAYDYLLANKSMPMAQNPARDSSGFKEFVNGATVNVNWGDDASDSYKDIMRKRRLADYESLA